MGDGFCGRYVDNRDRFQWVEKAVGWRPFIVLSRETHTQHVLLESRWEEPIAHPLIHVALELAHDDAKGQWQPVGTWSLHLDEVMWAELANVGTSVTMAPGNEEPSSPEVEPEDLHDLLRPTKPIPDKGFDAGPSYLDFPDD
ncbi:MAG TPA: hypothetical protein VMS60_15450 [Solirubrobacterales bacterium]|nr:hypothetical protein [Solirubrobacterales bacterium]